MLLKEILDKALRWENVEYDVAFTTLLRYCEYQKCNISNFRKDLRQTLITMRAKKEIQDFRIADTRISIFR